MKSQKLNKIEKLESLEISFKSFHSRSRSLKLNENKSEPPVSVTIKPCLKSKSPRSRKSYN